MQSILEITAPIAETKLTTLARVKAELDIKGSDHDIVLKAKIDEASSDVQAALGYKVPSQSVIETFWHEHRHASYGFGYGAPLGHRGTDVLFLRLRPVSALASVTVDDIVLDAGQYRLDAETGLLYRLDGSGFPCVWVFCKSILVAYTGGYVLPGQPNRNLEPAIEGATVALVQCFWFNRGRDPTIKVDDTPGLQRYEYWIGSIGDPEQLPPSVLMMLAPFKRPRMAVA